MTLVHLEFYCIICELLASLVAQMVKYPLAMWKTWIAKMP